MKITTGAVLFLAVVAGRCSEASAQVPQATNSAAILEVIPAECWAFVVVRELRELDAKLAQLTAQLDMPRVSLAESLETRFQLGPRIKPQGSIAAVFMPAESLATLGTQTVLIVPCDDVALWLADFPSQKLPGNVWRCDLVWGPTYVAQKNAFAILGTTKQATLAVLQCPAAQSRRYQGALLERFQTDDLTVGIAAGRFFNSPAMADWWKPDGSQVQQQTFNTQSLLYPKTAILKAFDYASIGLHLNNARLMCTADLQLQAGTALATLLRFGALTEGNPLALLPDQPFVLAAGAGGDPQQLAATAEEFDKLFDSEPIQSATVAAQLATFRRTMKQLIAAVRGGSWGLASVPQNPGGLVTLQAVLRVVDTQHWLGQVRTAATVLGGEGFFANPKVNTYFKSITYEAAADAIGGVAVDHLVIEPVARANVAPSKKVDFAAALGPGPYHVRLAAVDPQTVAICVGGYPRDMAALMRAAKDPDSGLHQHSGWMQVKPFLPPQHNLIAYFWPQHLLNVGRTLARMQDKVEQYPYRIEDSNVPLAATLTSDGKTCRIHAALSVDLAAGIKRAYFEKQSRLEHIKPPEDGN